MTVRKRTYTGVALLALLGAAGGTVASLAQSASAGGSGALDDGKELLSQAKISLADAIARAQTAGAGDVGEVDLEYFNGKLVFNIDIGDRDVKVDAASGEVSAAVQDE